MSFLLTNAVSRSATSASPELYPKRCNPIITSATNSLSTNKGKSSPVRINLSELKLPMNLVQKGKTKRNNKGNFQLMLRPVGTDRRNLSWLSVFTATSQICGAWDAFSANAYILPMLIQIRVAESLKNASSSPDPAASPYHPATETRMTKMIATL